MDLDVYRPVQATPWVRTQFGFAPQHVLIGTVAFLRDYKGLDYLIEAAKLVTETHPECRFLLVGDGPERMNLLRRIHELGLSSRVVLAGFREDIPQLVAAMDIFVVSSVEGEGLPQSLTQAMAMERPVVATAVGSIAEVVKHEVTGLLVTPSNPAALAEQIEVLIRDQALCEKLARAGRELIVQSYSLEHMLDRTEGLYASLLGEQDGPNGPNELHGF